jgi:hypothetical protein
MPGKVDIRTTCAVLSTGKKTITSFSFSFEELGQDIVIEGVVFRNGSQSNMVKSSIVLYLSRAA